MHHHLLSEIISVYTATVTICSLLHTTLPPWDFLEPWPTAQKYYKAFIYVIGYIGLNGRSTVYQSISTSKKTNGTTNP